MRRLALLIGLALIVTGVVYGPTVARGYAPHKQTCKTVTKKIHGKKKKVRVCKSVKAKLTNTPTQAPMATSTATATATAIPATATSTATKTTAQRFKISHDSAGMTYVDDTETGMQAAAGRVQVGTMEALGTDFASLGLTAVFVYVQERNISFTRDNGDGPGTYRALNDFSLSGGHVSCCGPADQPYNPVHFANLIQGDVNDGWLTYAIPVPAAGDYTLYWRENLTDEIRRAVPFLQIHVD